MMRRAAALLAAASLLLGGCAISSEGRAENGAKNLLGEDLAEAEPIIGQTWMTAGRITLRNVGTTMVAGSDGYAIEERADGTIEVQIAFKRTGRDDYEAFGNTTVRGGACVLIVGKPRTRPSIEQIDCPRRVVREQGNAIQAELAIIDERRQIRLD